MSLKLSGVIPAVITPFTADGTINEKALRAEIEFHLSCGVSALCAGGSTGEGAGLNKEEVYLLNRIFVEQARERVPIIAGVIPDTTDEAVELGLAAKRAGATLLQVTPPHYLFQPGVQETVAYYSEIRRRTGLEIILYNVIPWAQVTTEGVARLLDKHAIVAVKQSGLNLHQVADMVHQFGKTVPILTAVDDLLYPAFVMGCQGTLSAIASVLPKQCVALYSAVQSGEHEHALVLHNQILIVWRALGELSGFHGRIKCAIELQGRQAGLPRHPQRPANADERERLFRAFHEAGLPTAVSVASS